jgi:ferredoxin-NADP reductase
VNAAAPSGFHDDRVAVVVRAIHVVSEDIRIYDLGAVDGSVLPAAEPGAHLDVFLPNGLVRQYSLMKAGAALDRYQIGVKRQLDGRGGSRGLQELFGVGVVVEVGLPRNHFPLVESAANTVFLAGGIGVTPLWAMAERLTEIGRPWSMHYFCRSPAEMILPDAMRAQRERVRTVFSVSEEPRRPTEIADIVGAAPPATHFYCCGPLPMLKDFEAATAGLPDAQVHVEYFSSDIEVDTAGGFVVELARSGLTLPVPPGRTIVQVVTEAGIDILSQCTQGYCGTCETRVLSGVPDHRDVVLTRAEKASNTIMMICCSRSLSPRLVLDL